MPIQLEERVQEILYRLQAQATARNVTLAEYLRSFADAAEITPTSGELSLEELDALLDDLAATAASVQSLPADFSRRDIYADHD
jgi:hypothetical protein